MNETKMITGGRKTSVEIAGGDVDVTVQPSTDFAPITLTVTTSLQTLSFPFAPTSVLIKALKENPGYVKILKTGGTDFYLMDPGEPVTIPITNASTTIDYTRDAGAGTYQITVIAVN